METTFFTGSLKHEYSDGTVIYRYANGKLIHIGIVCGSHGYGYGYLNGEKILYHNYDRRDHKNKYKNGKPDVPADKLIKKHVEFDPHSYQITPLRLINGILNGTEIITIEDENLIHHINWKNGVKSGPEPFYRISDKSNKHDKERKPYLIKVNHWEDGLRKEYNRPIDFSRWSDQSKLKLVCYDSFSTD